MKFLTGDDTGLIKVIHVEKQKALPPQLIAEFPERQKSSQEVTERPFSGSQSVGEMVLGNFQKILFISFLYSP